MIKITNTETYGWEAAIRGMRNPMNSWAKSDSYWTHIENPQTENTANYQYFVGDNDVDLMRRLVAAGSDHGKFMRMLIVTADVEAMQPWWSEFDTYKVATVRNSCSKMHKIHVKPFTIDDFSHEGCDLVDYAYEALLSVLEVCEKLRQDFNRTQDKRYWRALIELLPEGYNMKATVLLNYAVLKNMYHARKHHKLDEWHDFCRWVESLPYSYLIVGDNNAD
jgi:hypothetical protein